MDDKVITDAANLAHRFLDMAIEYSPKLLMSLITLIVGFWIIKGLLRVASRAMEKSEIDVFYDIKTYCEKNADDPESPWHSEKTPFIEFVSMGEKNLGMTQFYMITFAHMFFSEGWPIPLKHKDIAEFLNTDPKRVSQVIKSLWQRNILMRIPVRDLSNKAGTLLLPDHPNDLYINLIKNIEKSYIELYNGPQNSNRWLSYFFYDIFQREMEAK